MVAGEGVATERSAAATKILAQAFIGLPQRIKTEQSFDFKKFSDEDLWTLHEILKRRAAAADEGAEGANG